MSECNKNGQLYTRKFSTKGRFELVLCGVVGKHLTYKNLIR